MLEDLQTYLAELSAYDLAAQGVGFVAMGCALSAFATTCDRRFYLVLIATHTLFCAHFLMLGALAGAGANFIAIFRAWFARGRRGLDTCLVLVLAYIAMATLTVRAPVDLLAALAPIVGTPIMFLLAGWKMRVALLVCSSMWLTYNALSGSWGGVLNELTVMTINLITITRLLIEQRAIAPAKSTA